MQLNKTPNLKQTLMLATCGLLGTNIQAKDNILKDWDVNTAIMNYSETNRITATEGVIFGNKTFSDGQTLNLKFVFDTLTGASANGAVAQPTVQTFTSSSGRITTPSKAHDIPLDKNFHDTRGQGTIEWTQPLKRDITLGLGGYVSAESDYLSVGANSNIAFDFNQKNTTLSFGVASSYDQIKPHGGIHDGLSLQTQPTISNGDSESINTLNNSTDNKNTLDGLIGITQIINENMLVQLNYSYSKSNGYLTDPYKFLSEVDSSGLTQNIFYENRPRNRTKQALYLQSKYMFGRSILDTSFRYMKDDWGIRSRTLDVHFRFDSRGSDYIEPHFRYYHQSEADFYTPFLNQGNVLPVFASADFRLGDMDAYTYGLKYGMKINNGHDLSFRVEYYQQNVNNPGFLTPGVLSTEPVFNGIKALITQVNYSF